MSLDRRRFLQLGAGAAAAAVASPVFARGSRGTGEPQPTLPRATGPSPSTHRFRLGAMEVTIVNDGRFAIATGVHAIDSAGHTAGHIAVLAESEGEQLLLVGDAITNVHVAFEHPRWRFLYDDYGEQAIQTRMRLLERAASEGLLLTGYHFPFPAVGRVFRDGVSYRWLPAVVG